MIIEYFHSQDALCNTRVPQCHDNQSMVLALKKRSFYIPRRMCHR